MNIGAVTGRFQGVHNGYKEMFEEMIQSYIDTIYVGIANNGNKRTPSNPFTYEERLKMLGTLVYSQDVEMVYFPFKFDLENPITMIKTLLKTHRTLKERIPKNAVYWSGNWTHTCLARLCGFKVHKRKRTGPSASEVRKILAYEIRNGKISLDDRIRDRLKIFVPTETLDAYMSIVCQDDVIKVLSEYIK